MKTAKNLNWVIAVAGLWEVVAPFILSYSKHATPMWDAIIVGIVLIVLGAWAALANASGTIQSPELGQRSDRLVVDRRSVHLELYGGCGRNVERYHRRHRRGCPGCLGSSNCQRVTMGSV